MVIDKPRFGRAAVVVIFGVLALLPANVAAAAPYRIGAQPAHSTHPIVSTAAPAAGPVPSRLITSISGYDLGDGRRLTGAAISEPESLAFDSRGSLFFSDLSYHVIRRVDAGTGRVSTVVGNGRRGADRGNAVPPTAVAIGPPFGIALDAADNLIFLDIANHLARFVNRTRHPVTAYGITVPAGKMATIAGDGFKDADGGGRFTGDGGPATHASLNYPRDIALDGAGNVYFDDLHNLRVRRIDRHRGIITTVAGNGTFDLDNSGDGGPAVEASVIMPTGVAFDHAGRMVVAEWPGRIRRVDANGTITTIAGHASFDGGFGGDGGPATEATIANNPKGLVFDADGSLLFSDPQNSRVRRIDSATGIITTVVGSGFADELYGDSALSTADNGVHPKRAHLRYSAGLVFSRGGLLVADEANGAVRLVRPGRDGVVDGDPTERIFDVAVAGGLKQPFRIVGDQHGNILTSQNNRAQIVRVSPAGALTPLVGNGVLPLSIDGPGGDPRDNIGDGGQAIRATISPYAGLAFGPNGDLFIADEYTHRVRRVRATHGITPASTIETVAKVPFAAEALAVVDVRHIYLADGQHNRVWRLDGETGKLTLVAGNGQEGTTGDGGLAARARVGCPLGIAADAAGRTLFIASVCHGVVRAVDLRTGRISTVAKLHYDLFGGSDGEPVSLAVLGNRFLFITDGLFLNVFRVDLQSAASKPIIVAGSGYNDFPGFTGDHVPGPKSELNYPFGLAIDRAGKLYIADGQNQRIRRLGMVDILPGRYPNRVSTTGGGTVPVAFLSSYDFDATTLDPATIRVAGAPVATRPSGGFRAMAKDVNADGRPDLLVNIRESDLHLRSSDFEAVSTARTFGGTYFRDADWVTVVPAGDH